MKCIFSLIVALGMSLTIQLAAQNQPVHQLRIYELTKKNKEVFHERFKTEAIRIMNKYDFNIISVWETEFEDKVEFVYLLQWETEAALKKGWEGFMADQEWKDIKKVTSAKYGSFVEKIEDRTLWVQDYSPKKKF
ncbi:MAG: NIPSNAP family protein [Cyclobacteriaceae bacterium]|nr:NIPSNAP family protein [Cyclobacteriaceae bacterium]